MGGYDGHLFGHSFSISNTRRCLISRQYLLIVLCSFSLALNVYQFFVFRRLNFVSASSCDSCCDCDRWLAQKIGKQPSVVLDLNSGATSSAPSFARHLHSDASSSNNSSITSSSGSSASHDDHGPRPEDALLYLFNALVIGVGVMQLQMHHPKIQQTVVLFVLGVLYAVVMEGLNVKSGLGIWGNSYEMWMGIDPHLFMFALLPALLAGDAMTIDTSVAKRVVFQCLYLAGPGVFLTAMCTSFFLKYYLGWSFLLSLVAGSILCATDPVAVVALLKELGASPMLTVQIQGESLLNDGTSIVLYMIAYNMLSGENYDYADIAMFLVKKAMMAWALGLFCGYFFFSWMRIASNRLNHSSSMIQISLTICCAYWSYIVVEGVLKLSGVLATVASSLVLAHHMWPYVVSPDSMHHVWHVLEALGNVVVFFLAGSMTGSVLSRTEFEEYLHLLVIYIFLVAIRGLLIFASRPILQFLSVDKQEVSIPDATLMTWGGLRGAVGLALAISVHLGRAKDANGVEQITDKEAERLLFFVSGVAFLTTIVNAATAPTLVRKLGITATPQARQQLLKMFHQQLVRKNQEDTHDMPEVTEALREMLEEAEEEINHQQIQKHGPRAMRQIFNSLKRGASTHTNVSMTHKSSNKATGSQTSDHRLRINENIQANKELVKQLNDQKEKFHRLDKKEFKFLSELPPENLLGKVDKMVALVSGTWVDEGMAKVVNACFLSLVHSHYWKLIEAGDLRPGSVESEILFTSIRMSLSPYRADLSDFGFIKAHLRHAPTRDYEVRDSEEDLKHASEFQLRLKDSCIARLVASMYFNIFIAATILLNSIQVGVEEVARNEENDDNLAWIVLDGIFTLIFLVEFVLKFAYLGFRYFRDSWNIFDFTLVALGIFGLVTSIAVHGESSNDAGGHARIIRVARVLRTLRFLRVFRLFHAKLSADKFISVELATHMKTMQTLQCFVQAHLNAQIDLCNYFYGELDQEDDTTKAEIARCILQSQASVYEGLVRLADTWRSCLGPDLARELYNVQKRKNITETLEKFVLSAHALRAINGREAHAILHPLYDQISECMLVMHQRAEGMLDKTTHDAWQSTRKKTKESLRISKSSFGSTTSVTSVLRRSFMVNTQSNEVVTHLNGSGRISEKQLAAANSLGSSVASVSEDNDNPPFGRFGVEHLDTLRETGSPESSDRLLAPDLVDPKALQPTEAPSSGSIRSADNIESESLLNMPLEPGSPDIDPGLQSMEVSEAHTLPINGVPGIVNDLDPAAALSATLRSMPGSVNDVDPAEVSYGADTPSSVLNLSYPSVGEKNILN